MQGEGTKKLKPAGSFRRASIYLETRKTGWTRTSGVSTRLYSLLGAGRSGLRGAGRGAGGGGGGGGRRRSSGRSGRAGGGAGAGAGCFGRSGFDCPTAGVATITTSAPSIHKILFIVLRIQHLSSRIHRRSPLRSGQAWCHLRMVREKPVPVPTSAGNASEVRTVHCPPMWTTLSAPGSDSTIDDAFMFMWHRNHRLPIHPAIPRKAPDFGHRTAFQGY